MTLACGPKEKRPAQKLRRIEQNVYVYKKKIKTTLSPMELKFQNFIL